MQEVAQASTALKFIPRIAARYYTSPMPSRLIMHSIMCSVQLYLEYLKIIGSASTTGGVRKYSKLPIHTVDGMELLAISHKLPAPLFGCVPTSLLAPDKR